jgi:hypothetical protein
VLLGWFDYFSKPSMPAVLKAGRPLRTVELLRDMGVVMTLVGGKVVWAEAIHSPCGVSSPSYVTRSLRSCRAEQRFFRL